MTGEEKLLQAWASGAEEFNGGRFWNAHEEWERGWKDLPEPLRSHVQALIQIAAALYHVEKGRTRPALALCRTARDKLDRTCEPMAGVFPRPVIEGADEALSAILSASPGEKVSKLQTLRGSLQARVLLSRRP